MITKIVSIVLQAIYACMEIKERIQQQAEELFRRYGVKSVTMDEIASHLGVSKKTIYQYYSDKDELVLAVATHLIKYAEKCCDEHCTHAANAIEELFRAMEFGGEMFRTMNPSMLFDLRKYHPAAFKRFLVYKHEYMLKIFEKNIKRGIEEELYRPEIKGDIISRFRLETFLLPLDQEVFLSTRFNPVEVHREIMTHFLFGVVSLKGYKMILKYQQRNKQ